MPILNVRALPQKDPKKIKPALKKTCVAIAEVYGCKPSQVWGTWQELEPGFYVEGENEVEIQPVLTHPPIAQLTCFEGSSKEKVEKLLEVAAATLTEELGLSGKIFITYHEAKSGEVMAGNGILRKKK